jgi:hypothetical protein
MRGHVVQYNATSVSAKPAPTIFSVIEYRRRAPSSHLLYINIAFFNVYFPHLHCSRFLRNTGTSIADYTRSYSRRQLQEE